MDIVNLYIQIICGVFGGNVAGSLLEDKSLGNVANSVAGLAGGAISALIMHALQGPIATGVQNFNIKAVVMSVIIGGLSGAAFMALIGYIKSRVKK